MGRARPSWERTSAALGKHDDGITVAAEWSTCDGADGGPWSTTTRSSRTEVDTVWIPREGGVW